MKFPNAEKGIKKIFTAEILALLSMIGLAVSAVLGLLGLKSADGGNTLLVVAGAFGVATFILMLLGYILNIIGISQASKDEHSFKIALYVTIFGIVFSFVSGFLGNAFKDSTYVTRILGLLPDLINLIIMVYIVTGIKNISKLLSDTVMEGKGENILKLAFVMEMIIFVARSVSEIVNNQQVTALAVAAVIFAGILDIVIYVLYLSYLSKAKKMLSK